MLHFKSIDSLHLANTWLPIGTFDGVHRGDQASIRQLTTGARLAGAQSAVLTFFPHPAITLARRQGPIYLTTPDKRATLLGELGVDVVITHPFDTTLANVTAFEFMERLMTQLRLKRLILGYDSTLGKDREGNAARLTEIGLGLGYNVEVVPALGDESGVIIMAGGRGERFWPVSREKMPKQLITLLGERSFLQQAVARVLPLVASNNILVITNQVQAPAVRKQLPKLPKENVIAEPIGRDTCAAVTLGAALVGARSTTGVMAVLPADHVIPDEKKFQQVLSDSSDLAARGQAIITIGIKPIEPATGYGYIRVGEALPPPPGVKAFKTVFHRAEQFVGLHRGSNDAGKAADLL